MGNGELQPSSEYVKEGFEREEWSFIPPRSRLSRTAQQNLGKVPVAGGGAPPSKCLCSLPDMGMRMVNESEPVRKIKTEVNRVCTVPEWINTKNQKKRWKDMVKRTSTL